MSYKVEKIQDAYKVTNMENGKEYEVREEFDWRDGVIYSAYNWEDGERVEDEELEEKIVDAVLQQIEESQMSESEIKELCEELISLIGNGELGFEREIKEIQTDLELIKMALDGGKVEKVDRLESVRESAEYMFKIIRSCLDNINLNIADILREIE